MCKAAQSTLTVVRVEPLLLLGAGELREHDAEEYAQKEFGHVGCLWIFFFFQFGRNAKFSPLPSLEIFA